MLFLLWLVVICLLSSLDKIDVCVQVDPDDVWEYEDDKTGFFSFGVDNFNWLYLIKTTNFLAHGSK